MNILFYILNFKYSDILYCDILNVFICCVSIICLYEIIAHCLFKIWKSMYSRNNKNEWEWVGEITQILIYPIDGGPSLSVNRALCTRSGLRSHQFQDRSIIPYSENSNSAVLGFTTENNKDLFSNLEKCVTRFKQSRNFIEHPNPIEIDYLGDKITVLPFTSSVALLQTMKNVVLKINLGYFDVTKRRQFMKQIRDRLRQYFNIFLYGFPSNYSTFTLIDEENFKEFQRQNSKINFKPQLVVSGKIPFNVSDVRIGSEASKINFINIAPCNLVMPDAENGFFVNFFGFNMELKNQTIHQIDDVKRGAVIHLGDKVFIKYFDGH